jgi:hypothetical protein
MATYIYYIYTVPDCDAYPDDADFLTNYLIDLLDSRHE